MGESDMGRPILKYGRSSAFYSVLSDVCST